MVTETLLTEHVKEDAPIDSLSQSMGGWGSE